MVTRVEGLILNQPDERTGRMGKFVSIRTEDGQLKSQLLNKILYPGNILEVPLMLVEDVAIGAKSEMEKEDTVVLEEIARERQEDTDIYRPYKMCVDGITYALDDAYTKWLNSRAESWMPETQFDKECPLLSARIYLNVRNNFRRWVKVAKTRPAVQAYLKQKEEILFLRQQLNEKSAKIQELTVRDFMDSYKYADDDPDDWD